MNYLGIDLHKKSFQAVVMDQVGEVLHCQQYGNTREEVLSLLAQCPEKPSTVIEATQNWMWLVEVFQEFKVPVSLAHPLKTKAIASARIKNDVLDATTLAHLLRSNLVPPSYITTRQEQANRELARTRCQLVKQQTWCKNQIHAVLTKANLHPPMSDLFGTKGQAWLKEQKLDETKRLVIDEFLKLLVNTRLRIKTLEKIISQRCLGNRQIEILKSIPGFGEITAFILLAEIGDPERFDSGKKLAAYLGLVPSLYQSGKTKRSGRITKLGNPYARWVLVQAAHRLVRSDIQTKLNFAALAARRGKKKAIVAIARKIAVLSWRLLVDDRVYQQQAPGG
ncbi:MAG: IS110 family transposase [Candidatus Pacebacteria bacterium]|nr:IS110 family transposase [Candidatus Paceibacterota bacterium]